MMNRDFIEDILGGIFGIIAVLAAVVEVAINGISAPTVVAGIKDVFSALVIVVLFFSVVKNKIPSRDFRKSFDDAMKSVSNKYKPLIKKETITEKDETANSQKMIAKRNKLNKVICYGMASNINVLFGVSCNDYPRFMEIQNQETTVVKFLIRKKFFDYSDFNEQTLTDVGNKIKENLELRFRDYEFYFDENKKEIFVNINRLMKSNKDAIMLSELIDSATMLYIAESKK